MLGDDPQWLNNNSESLGLVALDMVNHVNDQGSPTSRDIDQKRPTVWANKQSLRWMVHGTSQLISVVDFTATI